MGTGNWGRPYIPESTWGHPGFRHDDYLLVAHTPTAAELEHFELLSPESAEFVIERLIREADMFFVHGVTDMYRQENGPMGAFAYSEPRQRVFDWLRKEIQPFMGCLTLLEERPITGPPLVELRDRFDDVTEEVKDWLEIILVDRFGRPVPGMAYEVRCADGRMLSGKLDKKGRAKHRDVHPGEAEVRFLNVHPDEWRLGESPANPTVALALHDADGEPIANARFQLKFETGEVVERSTGPDGSAALTDTPLGPYTISFPDHAEEDFK